MEIVISLFLGAFLVGIGVIGFKRIEKDFEEGGE